MFWKLEAIRRERPYCNTSRDIQWPGAGSPIHGAGDVFQRMVMSNIRHALLTGWREYPSEAPNRHLAAFTVYLGFLD